MGRRERKVRATRAALVEAAIDLFETNGFDATSVEQIADRVDVSARTFHRYFAAKEDVLFADVADRHQVFEEILAARPTDEPLLTSLREAALEHATNVATRPAHEARRLRIIEGHPALDAHSVVVTAQWGQVVVGYTARRLGLARTDLLPRLLGSLVPHTLRVARQRWSSDPSLDFTAEVARAFEVLSNMEATIERAQAPSGQAR